MAMLIRHTPCFPLPILSLMGGMILSPLVARLVFRIGLTATFAPASLPAVRATVIAASARDESTPAPPTLDLARLHAHPVGARDESLPERRAT
jgi:hypothetical protein